MLDSRESWDSEAASDFISYQRPIEWDAAWWRSNKAFDLSIGSISSKQFLIYQRLKLQHRLTEHIELRVHWLEARDFEQDRVAMPLELRYDLTPGLTVGILGQPSLYKAEDDIGLLTAFRPNQNQEIQLTALWADFQRNNRNLQSDRWRHQPQSYTLTSTHLASESKTDFRRFEFHYEPNSVRELAGVSTSTLSYQMISLSGLHTFGLGSTLGYRLQADQAYYEDHVLSSVRQRKRSLNQVEMGWYHETLLFKPGFNFQYRENRENQKKEFTRDIVPTFWCVLPEGVKDWGGVQWSLGYDVTAFDRDSDLQSEQRNIEHRGNIRSEMKFAKAGQLALLLTFDLDRFGSGETWEGGAGQFRLDF
jgi:hypothetical protein